MYDFETIIELSGVLAIDRYGQKNKFINYSNSPKTYGVLISFHHIQAGTFLFSIHEKSGTIHFETIGKVQARISIYFSGWVAIVSKKAKALRYKKITLFAEDNVKDFDVLVIHQTMIDFGFEMSEKKQLDFLEVAAKFDPDIKNLKELLTTEAGVEHWRYCGFGWLGTLSLEKDELTDEKLKAILLKSFKFRNYL
jgi:hypothetical protein